jgi:hypothetical protein
LDYGQKVHVIVDVDDVDDDGVVEEYMLAMVYF